MVQVFLKGFRTGFPGSGGGGHPNCDAQVDVLGGGAPGRGLMQFFFANGGRDVFRLGTGLSGNSRSLEMLMRQ